MLNTEIKEIIDGTSNLMELNDFMKKKYDELEEDVKEIKVEVSIDPHNGTKRNIRIQEGVLIKCKSVHYPIVNQVLLKMANKNYFRETYRVVPRTMKSKEPGQYNKVL